MTHFTKIRDLCIDRGYKTAIDFGCGKGILGDNLNTAIRELICFKYDPAIEEFNKYPVTSDLLIANDVLEHFDPHELTEELTRINDLAVKGIFLNISCRPAVQILPNGLNAHTSLFDWQTWIEKCNVAFIGKELKLVEWNKKNQNVVLFYESIFIEKTS